MLPSADTQRTNALKNLFADYEGPAFALRFWDGWVWRSTAAVELVFTLVVRNEQALRTLMVEPNEISLGEAFIHNDLDVEGDIFSVFSIVEHLLNRDRTLRHKTVERMVRACAGVAQRIRLGSRNSMRRDRASIAYHYDQPFEFFRPWLGPTLVYSCAYFRDAEETLDRAQEQKLELVCRKLRLQPLESFLDIGCGWGSLLLHAAKRHHVHAHGITLSKEQEAVVRRRIREAGMQQRCMVELRDYRTLEDCGPQFDKIASVGMFEHVGLGNLPRYFRIAGGLLKPGGVFLNHGIARSALSRVRRSSFIDRFVFPDGRLVTLTEALNAAESQGFEVRDVENLREHYAITLRRWVEGLRAHREQLLKHVSEDTYRIWLLYMAGSSAAFCRGDIAVYQVLFRRCRDRHGALPLTREDWFEPVTAREEVEV